MCVILPRARDVFSENPFNRGKITNSSSCYNYGSLFPPQSKNIKKVIAFSFIGIASLHFAILFFLEFGVCILKF